MWCHREVPFTSHHPHRIQHMTIQAYISVHSNRPYHQVISIKDDEKTGKIYI